MSIFAWLFLEGNDVELHGDFRLSRGDMCLALADMSICEEMTPEWLSSHENEVKQAALVIADLNLPQETLENLIQITNLENSTCPLFQ